MKTPVVWAACFLVFATANALATSGGIPNAILREIITKMGNDLADSSGRRDDYSDNDGISLREAKELSPPRMALDYDDFALSPSLRDQEYLRHSSLLGSILGDHSGFSDIDVMDNKFRFKPSTNGVKVSELKTDSGVLPAYCNPPNPCPVGYTAANGCLGEFENTAAFSRNFQAMQDCMCDTEHMFECPDSSRDNEIPALARSIQNQGVMDSTLDEIIDQMNINPYLQGEKLPIAAKKGEHF